MVHDNCGPRSPPQWRSTPSKPQLNTWNWSVQWPRTNRRQKLAIEHIRRNIFHLIDTKLTLGYAESRSNTPAAAGDTSSSAEPRARSTTTSSSSRHRYRPAGQQFRRAHERHH